MLEFVIAPSLPNLFLELAPPAQEALLLHLRSTSVDAPCPVCKQTAVRVQSRYVRSLSDLACQNTPVEVRLHVRRFWCDNAPCGRAIFTERLMAFAPPYARRTLRSTQTLLRVGVALAGEAGAALLPTLGLSASADTLLRRVHGATCPDAPPPRVVGVDDWAIRRGHVYGTIIVDLERRTVIDLLPDRNAETLAAWLKAHPGVEVISRDRSETYAQGARDGAPDAVQVADRWHLLKNVVDVLERLLHRHGGALREAACVPPAPRSPPTTEVAMLSSDPPTETGNAARTASAAPPPATGVPAAAEEPTVTAIPTREQALYDQVRTLHAEGLSIHTISKRTGVSRPTVRKYLRADTCPQRAPRRTKIGAMGVFDAWLRKRWGESCHDANVLWGELKAQGFRGTLRTVQRHVARWRSPADTVGQQSGASRGSATSSKPPSPRQLRWWLRKPEDEQPAEQVEYVRRLVGGCPAIATGQHLAQEFRRIVRTQDAKGLDAWLEQAEASALAEFEAFATGLRRELGAIVAALSLPWSNGQTEGQVNKLKMLKRQMFGRASVKLLRQRLRLAD